MFSGIQTRGVRSYSYNFYIVFYHKFLHHFWFVCLCIVAYKNCLHFLISVKLCFILQYLGNEIPHTCWINSLQANKQSIYPIPWKSYNCTNARVVSHLLNMTFDSFICTILYKWNFCLKEGIHQNRSDMLLSTRACGGALLTSPDLPRFLVLCIWIQLYTTSCSSSSCLWSALVLLSSCSQSEGLCNLSLKPL